LTYAEPSAHWYARGSGARARVAIERMRVLQPARVELVGDGQQRGSDACPVVERVLQRARDLGDRDRAREMARHDDERAVARPVVERRELHAGRSWRRFSA
jgi:hypothetical protein